MKSFNEKFSKSCVNFAFWHDLCVSLERAEAQLNFHGSLSQEDRKVHRIVSKGLQEILQKAQQAECYHSRQLKKLKGEYLNER